MPIEVTLDDYNRTEKVADLPRRLSTVGAPDGADPVVRDIAYHAPWGSSAVQRSTPRPSSPRALSEGLRQEMAPYNIRTNILLSGAVKTELLDHISEKDVQQANRVYMGEVGVPAETLARMVAFAINELEDVGINEILFRPTTQEL